VKFLNAFSPAALALALAAVPAFGAESDAPDAPSLGDYQAHGFLSDYSKLTPNPEDDGAFYYRAHPDTKSPYNKLMIDRIKIFFKDDADYKGIDPTELKALTDYFHDAIVKEVSGDYPVVEEPGPDVLRLRIALTDVVANKPEASVVTLVVPFLWVGDAATGVADGEPGSTMFVGEASVEMEALDSVTSEQIGAYVDTRIPKKYNWGEGVTRGATDYVNSYSTWAYVKESMDYWAKALKERIDQAHGKTAATN
jgi:hypothetical protein